MTVYVRKDESRCPNCSSPMRSVGSHHADDSRKCTGDCGLTFLVGEKPYRDEAVTDHYDEQSSSWWR